MKLCTYQPHTHADARIGAVCTLADRQYVVDVTQAHAHQLRASGDGHAAQARAAARIPASMIELLRAGPPAMAAVRHAVDHVQGLLGAADGWQAAQARGLLQALGDCILLAPLPRPGKVLAVGANYQAHIQEGRDTGALGALPPYPPAFLKMTSSVVGPDAVVPYPPDTEELDYEVELCMVVGRECRDVAPERWREVVAGFTIANDLGRRDVILREKASGIILEGKSFPGACPLGPWLVTADEIPDPSNLAIGLRVNGQQRQQDRTSSMIHGFGEIVSYWSRLGFEPGDVITTGTPGGVAGFGKRHPERLLKPGDVIEAEVEGIGVLRTHIGAPAARGR